MSPRLPQYRPESERDMATESRRRREHAEALATAIGRITRFVSDALGNGYSMRTLEEMTHGDARTPAEVLETAIQTARDRGRPEADAVAPLRVLAGRLGYTVAPAVATIREADVVGRAADASREFSEALGACLSLARAGFRTPEARDMARRELAEAISELHRLAAEVEALYSAPQLVRIEVGAR